MPRGAWRNDPSVLDEAPLWRGIEQDEITEQGVPSLGVLISHEVSVSIGSETNSAAVFAKGVALGRAWCRLWEFTAGAARAAGCLVDRDPALGNPNPVLNDPAHAIVLRADAPGVKRIKDSSAKKLILSGRWYV
jgi:hypothetical protein